MEQSITLVSKAIDGLPPGPELAQVQWHLSAALSAISTYFDAAFIAGCDCYPSR